MKERFSGETAEREETRENLVNETAKKIYTNLVESGLAEQIILNSVHARKPFDSNFYTQIRFSYEMTSKDSGGVVIQPRFDTQDRTGQPVTTKLYRMKKLASGERNENKMWADVTVEQKRALIETAIDYQIAKQQGTINSAGAMADVFREDGENDKKIEQRVRAFTDPARKFLDILEKVRIANQQGSLKEEIDPEYGWLTVYLDK